MDEDEFNQIVAVSCLVIVLLIIVGVCLYQFYSVIFSIYIFFKPIDENYKRILERNFYYYKQLNARDKKKFEKRLKKFIVSKNFLSGEEGFIITTEMKVLISATAIQISFGLPYISLVSFGKILIFRDKYYSPATDHYHKGEVNPPLSMIILSWKHYLEGYITADDGLNVGIHEMAHAHHIEDYIKNSEYDYLDRKTFNDWNYLAKEEMEKIKSGENQFFRAYGATNTHEFFAVAVECFFEKPEEFKLKHIELYLTLKDLLNQDPLELYRN